MLYLPEFSVKLGFVVLFAVLLNVSCKKNTSDKKYDGFHPPVWVSFKTIEGGRLVFGRFLNMDTIYSVTVAVKNDREEVKKAVKALKKVRKLISGIERNMSSHLRVGDIYNLNVSNGKKTKISPETFYVIKNSLEISKFSNGAFDITWAALQDLYNIKKKNWVPPTEKQLKEALKYVGWKKITLYPGDFSVKLQPGMKLDLGGIAKGYALDKASETLVASGFKNHIVNGGGDIKVSGKRPDRMWKLSVRHPRRKNEMLKRGFFKGGAIVTSGDYERFKIVKGKRYSHILDPRIGHTEQKIISVTVTGKSAMTADALATAICVEGAEQGMKMLKSFKGYEALIVDKDLNIFKTEGFDSGWEK